MSLTELCDITVCTHKNGGYILFGFGFNVL